MLRVAYHIGNACIPTQEVFKDHLALAEYIKGCEDFVFVHLPEGIVMIPKEKIDYVEIQDMNKAGVQNAG